MVNYQFNRKLKILLSSLFICASEYRRHADKGFRLMTPMLLVFRFTLAPPAGQTAGLHEIMNFINVVGTPQ